MFLFYVAGGVIFVALVFNSSGVDYRFVAAGSVLPLVENLSGSAWLLHTLAGAVGVLVIVMAATVGRGRRLKRRRWLGMPVGMLVFLVAAGVWTRSDLLWWPLAGMDALGVGTSPEFDRPLGVLVMLEVAGLAGLWWIWVRYGLADPKRRRDLLVRGRLA